MVKGCGPYRTRRKPLGQRHMERWQLDYFAFFLLTLGIAAVGGLIGLKLKIPAGAMMGAMLFVVLFNLLFEHAVFYPNLRIVIQILSGAMVGSRMDMNEVKGIKKLFFPILILIIGMLVINISLGLLIYWLSPLDAATALFAVAPGGASDMAIIGTDLGANPSYIAVLQLFRLIVIFTFMPPIFKKLLAPSRDDPAMKASTVDSAAAAPNHPNDSDSAPKPKASMALKERLVALLPKAKRLAALILSAAIVGICFYLLGITAGAMIGGMLGGTIYCCIRGKVAFPSKLRVVMQIGSGAFIGVRLNRESLMTMGDLLIPLIIAFAGIFAYSFFVAFLIHKITKLNLSTCLLASTPGGKQEMTLMSEDVGADTPSVAIMQTSRLICVIAFFPTMLDIITQVVP